MLLDYNFTLQQFAHLHQAFIDASSIIYATKSEFFAELQEALILYTLPEILDEARVPVQRIQCVASSCVEGSNDQKLVACAIARQLPVISEDKKILRQIRRANLPYYNALMMLIWLAWKKKLSQQHYHRSYEALRQVARYSQDVWEYGAYVYQLAGCQR